MSKGKMIFKAMPWVLALGMLGLFGFSHSCEKTAFVQSQRLFDEFEGTQALLSELRGQEAKQKAVLDSLQNQIILLDTQGDPAANQKKEVYRRLSEEFSGSLREREQEYTAEVWTQLNAHIEAFGKDQGYSYIFGAHGQGNLMFAQEGKDVTQELLDFANRRYQGYEE